MDLTGKTVIVVGSGISGVAATELLKKKNVNVVLFDGNKELDLSLIHIFRRKGITIGPNNALIAKDTITGITISYVIINTSCILSLPKATCAF